MGDLINREVAIISLVYADETSCITCGDLANVIKVLLRVPSAQPEIIRCKDCLLWHKSNCPMNIYVEKPDANYFCATAKAEKRLKDED